MHWHVPTSIQNIIGMHACLQIDTPAMISLQRHKLQQAGAAVTSNSGSAEHPLKAASYAAASAGTACVASICCRMVNLAAQQGHIGGSVSCRAKVEDVPACTS